jgi:signal transduction histidine kinase/DNA-binding response OmpR family regulator
MASGSPDAEILRAAYSVTEKTKYLGDLHSKYNDFEFEDILKMVQNLSSELRDPANKKREVKAYQLLRRLHQFERLHFVAEARLLDDLKEESVLSEERGIHLLIGCGGIALFIICLILIRLRKILIEEEQARYDAFAAAQSKVDFLANMSHEMRTPMNGVIGMTSLLSETNLNKEQLEYVKTIQKSGETLVGVINDVLDFSKMESGKFQIESVDFDLRETLEDIIQLLATSAHEKGLELIFAMPPNVPVKVSGDPARLRQILINLVGNAIKFTKSGTVVLRISVDEESSGKVPIRFDVIDSGIGIPKESLENIFESFSQAETSTTRRFGGTGLGLTISKALVELMGGSIGVQSTEGVGSTFWVSIRFKINNSPAKKDYPEWCDYGELKSKRVLSIDDNATNREVISQYLKSWGLNGDSAESGKKGLGMLRDAAKSGRPYDLLLLDMQMPELDGMGVLSEIRKESGFGEDLRIIFLTSTGFELREKALAAGADDYLLKPIRQSALFDKMVSNLFGRCELPVDFDAVVREGRAAKPVSSRILIVEDNPINQKVIAAMVKGAGYLFDIVGDGAAAVKAVEQGRYALVLMDCQMPIMDGYDATREIRRKETNGKRIPIIAVTAHALEGDREKVLEAGMDDYIAKPVKKDVLESLLSQYVESGTADLESEKEPASKSSSSSAPLDEEVLAELRELQEEGEPDILEELSSIYIEDARKSLDRMRAAAKAGDTAALAKAAHRLKGGSCNIGAKILGDLCQELEDLGNAGKVSDAGECIDKVECEFDRVQAAFKK